jgi:hypothetical protein
MCVLRQLDITDSNISPEQAMTLLNPSKFRSVHYLCGACEKTVIPSQEAGLIKRKPTTTDDSIGIDTSIQLENEAIEPTTISTSTKETQPHNDNSADNKTKEKWTTPCAKAGKHTDQHARLSQANDQLKVCPFYRKGTCRYGSIGKDCPYNHPRPCKKFCSMAQEHLLAVHWAEKNAPISIQRCAPVLSKMESA